MTEQLEQFIFDGIKITDGPGTDLSCFPGQALTYQSSLF